MVLYLTAKRLPMSNIAGRLHLTEKAVKTEFSRALRKLKSRNLRRLFGQIAEKT
jgi:DNA-binding NarL/FixJ family response regulator